MTIIKAKLKTTADEVISGFKLIGVLSLALVLGAVSVVLRDDLLE